MKATLFIRVPRGGEVAQSVNITPNTNAGKLKARGVDAKDLGFADWREDAEKMRIIARMRRLGSKYRFFDLYDGGDGIEILAVRKAGIFPRLASGVREHTANTLERREFPG